MGKRIIARARGKGGPAYKSPGHRYAGAIKYPLPGAATVTDIIHDACRDAPVAELTDENRKTYMVIAAEGIAVGDRLNIGAEGAEAKNGAILPLKAVPKGSFIFAIENVPQGGPKLCCAAGTKAVVVAQEEGKVLVQMPSKQFRSFHPECLATMGIPAGGGRGEKLMVKAGQMFYKRKSRNKLWPRSSAVKMNPVDHPFGGHTKPGMPKSASRWAPPGQKVGAVAPRRMGIRKKK
jgi:large subunit ribosomal protein L2